MKTKRKCGPRIWTKDKCLIEASKYIYRGDFEKKSHGAYKACRRYGWMEEACLHMVSLVKRSYSIEECQLEALKYKHRVDFQRGSRNYYTKCHRAGWLDDVCAHMSPLGNHYYRMVYAYEFPDKSVYIGLTFNSERRYWQHIKQENTEKNDESQVKKYIRKTGLSPTYKPLTAYIPAEEAQEIENKTIKDYKDQGWNILNIKKGGSLGSTKIKWTKKKVFEEAKKYNSITIFQRERSRPYALICRFKWYEALGHMKRQCRPARYFYDKERCKAEALKYKNISSFHIKSKAAYRAAKKFGWLEEFTWLINPHRKPYNYWTKDRCREEALKYSTRKVLAKNAQRVYNLIRRNGWQKEMFSHMKNPRNRKY